jgi:hypothetical protein
MTPGKLRRIHRWIFIFMGIFIVSWLLSGLLMATPSGWFGPVAKHVNPAIDYNLVTMSPAEAIKRLTEQDATATDIKNVSMLQINEDVLYSIRVANGDTRLINASNGELFIFTEQLALDIIRNSFKVDTPLEDIEHLTQHDRTYPWGELPAWRVRFEDNPSNAYYLAEPTLKVYRSSIATRIRAAITSLHEFTPVTIITSNRWVRTWLLIIVAAISLAGAVIGVWLTLPRRAR